MDFLGRAGTSLLSFSCWWWDRSCRKQLRIRPSPVASLAHCWHSAHSHQQRGDLWSQCLWLWWLPVDAGDWTVSHNTCTWWGCQGKFPWRHPLASPRTSGWTAWARGRSVVLLHWYNENGKLAYAYPLLIHQGFVNRWSIVFLSDLSVLAMREKIKFELTFLVFGFVSHFLVTVILQTHNASTYNPIFTYKLKRRSPLRQFNNGRSECLIVNARLTFILLGNTKLIQIHTDLKWIESTFIDNDSSNNYEMFNTKYRKIRMQSIVFVTLRIPNNNTEIPLTKK